MKCPKCASRGTFIGDSNSLMRCSWCGYLYSADKAMQDLLEAERTRADRAEARVKELGARIAELTAPKTCDGCDAYGVFTNDEFPCVICSRSFKKDRYTPRREGDK